MKADVALLTDRRYVASEAPQGDWYLANILHDDRLLQSALEQLGLSSARVDWSSPTEDWSKYRCAVFRSTWDYFDRFGEFAAWLDRVAPLTRLCNELPIIRWNMDKHYLTDLAAKGVPVVQSRFVERGMTVRLRDLLEETGWHDAVIKPCVSGAARHTYRVSLETADHLDAVIQPLLTTESLLLQPFERTIIDSGEDSLMIFGGRYSHAVRKIAKPGDFRVQDDHGGTVRPHHPTPAQIELAQDTIAACDSMPAYGRVDMIQNSQGRDVVMEMELVEPELWLRFHPASAAALAQAIAAWL